MGKDKRHYTDRQEYQRRYQKRWRRKNRDDAIDARGGCCCICGSSLFLEFHHTDPKKKITHTIWSWSKKRREAELAKCVLYCRFHHKHWHITYEKLIRKESVPEAEIVRYGLYAFVTHAAPTL